MRNFIKKLALPFCLICVFFALGCSGELERNYNRISEIRDELMVGNGSNFSVEVISGVRENPFVIDGKSSGKRDFTVVTVKGEFSPDKPVQYSLTYNGIKYDGTLDKHPLKNSYSTELNVVIKGEVEITVYHADKSEKVSAKSVKRDDTITCERALEIARTKLGKRMNDGELYIRYIVNPISTAQGYYYYVAVCPDEDEVYAVLIDEINGQIVAVRE
ncbi:MAG: hypothetical protein IKC64_06210 [Clostridia bacterium]|nr:hypothetical protein [Clostridia bacterium]